MTEHTDSYLLMLQNFRNATNDLITPFFEGVSAIAVSPIILIAAAIVYWSWDKQSGTWFLFAYSAVQYVNAVIKLTFCIYRPWIYCPSLTPAGKSIETALGYSFPSGHSSAAAVIYGTPMFALYRKRLWAAIVFGLMILLTMFSRNYLGVHTLQDVIVGAGVSLIIVYLSKKLIDWADRRPYRDIIILCASMFAIAAAMIYFIIKPYPMDYIDNILLADPIEMQETAFMGLGFLTGIDLGWFIERRFVRFDNSGSVIGKSICSAAGIAVFGVIYMLLHKVVLHPLSANVRYYIEMTFTMLYIIGLWPVAVKHLVNKKEQL